MITFNLRAHNGNYYCGHEPSNDHGVWGDQDHALVLSIEQARAMAKAWRGHLNIIIAIESEAMAETDFHREVFCAGGGNWYDWKGA